MVDHSLSLLQALAFIQEKYEGAELWGRVALAHSGVLWLESVEERVFLKDLRLHTSLSNWRKQFLAHKLGEDNPDVSTQLSEEVWFSLE